MNAIFQHVGNIFSMGRGTFIVIFILCGLAAYFMKEYLANPPMIIFVYPVLVLFAVLAQYAFVLAELYPPNQLDQWLMWTIMASICGTILGICSVTGLVLIKEALEDKSAKQQPGRNSRPRRV
jgi:hypothetical protein